MAHTLSLLFVLSNIRSKALRSKAFFAQLSRKISFAQKHVREKFFAQKHFAQNPYAQSPCCRDSSMPHPPLPNIKNDKNLTEKCFQKKFGLKGACNQGHDKSEKCGKIFSMSLKKGLIFSCVACLYSLSC